MTRDERVKLEWESEWKEKEKKKRSKKSGNTPENLLKKNLTKVSKL